MFRLGFDNVYTSKFRDFSEVHRILRQIGPRMKFVRNIDLFFGEGRNKPEFSFSLRCDRCSGHARKGAPGRRHVHDVYACMEGTVALIEYLVGDRIVQPRQNGEAFVVDV
jgi:hypothetical protein